MLTVKAQRNQHGNYRVKVTGAPAVMVGDEEFLALAEMAKAVQAGASVHPDSWFTEAEVQDHIRRTTI